MRLHDEFTLKHLNQNLIVYETYLNNLLKVFMKKTTTHECTSPPVVLSLSHFAAVEEEEKHTLTLVFCLFSQDKWKRCYYKLLNIYFRPMCPTLYFYTLHT